jgi:hypothetical protein
LAVTGVDLEGPAVVDVSIQDSGDVEGDGDAVTGLRRR